MDENIHIVEKFYGVYLLYCENPKFLGRTYIGFTVDPNRRIKQHNKGRKAGGAWRTSNRGPWKMVLIVHGFPNDIAALRFEWAWQNPQRSRRLNHLPKKKNSEKVFDYLLRILSEMLRTGPWNRLPLTIRWLHQDYSKDFSIDHLPPIHMPICYGPVISKKLTKVQDVKNKKSEMYLLSNDNNDICFSCKLLITDANKLKCISPECDMIAHFECLAKLFLEIGEYVPIEGDCPKCGIRVLWGDLVRKFHGCYKHLETNSEVNEEYTYSDISDIE